MGTYGHLGPAGGEASSLERRKSDDSDSDTANHDRR